MDPQELQKILTDHAIYLKREGGSRATLRKANLEGANLYRANLRDANLEGANFEGANLVGANLEGAKLEGANLEGANLRGANLCRAYIFRANLEGAILEGANLREASLREANLYCANLEGANLYRANLRDANLEGAELPSPTAVLLSQWGELSDELTADLMNYDASCHPDSSAFDRWVEGKGCPYSGAKIRRAANFLEIRILYDPSRPLCRPYDLMMRCFEEKGVRR